MPAESVCQRYCCVTPLLSYNIPVPAALRSRWRQLVLLSSGLCRIPQTCFFFFLLVLNPFERGSFNEF